MSVRELEFFVLGIVSFVGLYLVGMTVYGVMKLVDEISIGKAEGALKRALEPPHTAKGQV